MEKKMHNIKDMAATVLKEIPPDCRVSWQGEGLVLEEEGLVLPFGNVRIYLLERRPAGGTLTGGQAGSGEIYLLHDYHPVSPVGEKGGQWAALSFGQASERMEGAEICWAIPEGDGEEIKAVQIRTAGKVGVTREGSRIAVEIGSGICTVYPFAARPRADFWGNRYCFEMEDGEILQKTLAHFYWDTILPSVIERTKARAYPDSGGYVASTLKPGEYAGTYPDVDHEFQCKGRIAVGSELDLAVVRRMLELQFRMMKEDPAGLWRNPCAVQPDGTREYHVRRNSLDGTVNAEMFLITGNVEVLETAWLYMAATKDRGWLKENIPNLEGAASLLEYLTDCQGRLWSDVYYEDQVMKDGRECMSAAMAANGLARLAELEELLGRKEEAEHWRVLSGRIAAAMCRPMPAGFWDEANRRFADWVDRDGKVHDHIHLLANSLPLLFGYADAGQRKAITALIEEYLAEFQRFPTFLSARIEDYEADEIGVGGPYDLCAAGRYWCWDAAYWAKENNRQMLAKQLRAVADQAEWDCYRMGERYDMNHIYYLDDKNWHGAPYYYEYPNVFAWVLIHDYLGVSRGLTADLAVEPRIAGYGRVLLEAYRVEYEYRPEGFRIKNWGERPLDCRLDLSALGAFGKKGGCREVSLAAGQEIMITADTAHKSEKR